MQDLVDKIKQKDGLRLGSKADVRKILDCKKHLEDENIAPIPDDYSLFIKYINGIYSDAIQVYGVSPETNKGFKDLLLKNEELDRADKYKVLVIGQNIFDWLVYDWEQKEYQTRDLSDGFVIERFPDIKTAFGYFLGL